MVKLHWRIFSIFHQANKVVKLVIIVKAFKTTYDNIDDFIRCRMLRHKSLNDHQNRNIEASSHDKVAEEYVFKAQLENLRKNNFQPVFHKRIYQCKNTLLHHLII